MHDPTGLYWLGPLAAALASAIGALVMVVALGGVYYVLALPRARRNRAKLRARRQRERDAQRVGIARRYVAMGTDPAIAAAVFHVDRDTILVEPGAKVLLDDIAAYRYRAGGEVLAGLERDGILRVVEGAE